ncbi:MAG: flagellar biosynthesis anti-sigma factor FlgM [Gemmatimonadaceae bacterium]
MKINSSIFDPLRPDRTTSTDSTSATRAGGNAQPVSPVAPVSSRRDSVQISDSARTLASRAESNERAQLDPARVSELRKKVYEGAYNSLDVVDQVARRILTRGDI